MAAEMKFLAVSLFSFIFFHSALAQTPSFNVQFFGARPDGKTDCADAFLSAWAAACASAQRSIVYVPPGRYLIGRAVFFFGGNCTKTSGITFQVDGTLVAPSNYYAIDGTWIVFHSADGLTVLGGKLDGKGTSLRRCKTPGQKCPAGAASLGIYNSNNVGVVRLSSSNSKFFHIILVGVNNIKLQGLTISAPGDSPNTDGIHVALSTNVTIIDSHIGTGDDCISIGAGCTNLWIERIHCGPGHGISIGSLGSNLHEAGVRNVTVKSVTFTGTQNGGRIKTWAKHSDGFVQDVMFQKLTMIDVQNPIIIDQNYCPNSGGGRCSGRASGVRISNVAYKDVQGISATQVAVKFDCSKDHPCRNITLENVNLTLPHQLPANASCVNARGTSSGIANPRSCLQ